MTFLDVLQPDEQAIVENNLEVTFFPKDTCIIEQGSEGNGCYLIDQGRVRIELDTGEIETDVVLHYLDPGMILGEFSLLDRKPRSTYAFAHTDVTARWLSTTNFEAICAQYPSIGLKLLHAFSNNLITIVRESNQHLADFMATDTQSPLVEDMMARAVAAQKSFEGWAEDKVDALLKDIAETIAAQAEVLARMTVEETGLGVIEHKIQKIRYASLNVYEMLAGQHASGLIKFELQKKISHIASPMGVVLGIIPLTNPVSTMIFKTLSCLKSRNALIMSCHRNALGVGNQTGEIIQAVLRKHNAPVNLVQWIHERSSRKLTNMFMRHKDLAFILATGGPSVVKAAYSSGTPAIGVGAGNAPVFISRDADPDQVAQMVVQSKSFDNGIICGSENNLVVEAPIKADLIAALKVHGAAVLEPIEINAFTKQVFDMQTGGLRKEMIGKSAESILHAAGLQRDYPVLLIVVPLDKEVAKGQYGREKLAPILSLFTVKDAEEGFKLAKEILQHEGQGHTAMIHTQDQQLAERFGIEMPASRILVNTPGAQGCIGIGTGLLPSFTLGCGTLGKTSTTDNVTFSNLLNIKRMAYAL
jgi:acyl-CoA reductase-like NAD-dependent aldehyde dehydrogenase